MQRNVCATVFPINLKVWQNKTMMLVIYKYPYLTFSSDCIESASKNAVWTLFCVTVCAVPLHSESHVQGKKYEVVNVHRTK